MGRLYSKTHANKHRVFWSQVVFGRCPNRLGKGHSKLASSAQVTVETRHCLYSGHWIPILNDEGSSGTRSTDKKLSQRKRSTKFTRPDPSTHGEAGDDVFLGFRIQYTPYSLKGRRDIGNNNRTTRSLLSITSEQTVNLPHLSVYILYLYMINRSNSKRWWEWW